MKKFYNWIHNGWKAFYAIWAFLNIMFLLLFEKTFQYKSEFWPFEDKTYLYPRSPLFEKPYGPYKNSYDYTEFIIYMLGPLLLAVALYFILSSNNNTNKTNLDTGNDGKVDAQVPEIKKVKEEKVSEKLKFCSKCGIQLDLVANFCSKCGTKQ